MFEMLFISELNPELNIQKDSFRCNLFAWHCVEMTSKRRHFLAILEFLAELVLTAIVLSQYFAVKSFNSFEGH